MFRSVQQEDERATRRRRGAAGGHVGGGEPRQAGGPEGEAREGEDHHEQRERAPEHPTTHNPVEGVQVIIFFLSGASAASDYRHGRNVQWRAR